MITETGQDITVTPEMPKLITAVLAHPMHGRLVERVMMMVSKTVSLKGVRYTLTWRDSDVAFYEPVKIH
jgi:hypothetical protein